MIVDLNDLKMKRFILFGFVSFLKKSLTLLPHDHSNNYLLIETQCGDVLKRYLA